MLRLSLFLILSLLSSTTLAKEKEPIRTGPYLGVQPGTKEVAPGKRIKRKGKRNIVTWVGFQMLGQGGRVFIQNSKRPKYELVSGPEDQIVIDLLNSRLQSHNDGRRLEAGWFPSAISWIDANQRRGNIVRVIIKMREIVGYDLRQDGNYLFFDFRPPTKPIVPPKIPVYNPY